MSRRKRRHTWKVRLSFEAIQDLADSILDSHARIITDGYALQPSSALWRKANGTLTARLVYRAATEAAKMESLVVTVRNIALVSDTLEEAVERV